MRTLFWCAVATLSLCTASQAQTEYRTEGNHNREIVCDSINGMLGRIEIDNLVWPDPSFFSLHGGFSEKPYDLFFRSNGVKDKISPAVERVVLLDDDPVRPVYVVLIRRNMWMLPEMEPMVQDAQSPITWRKTAQFVERTIPWLAAFDTDILDQMQEAPSLLNFARIKLRKKTPAKP